MARATWHAAVLADSNDGVVVENNYYFPTEAVDHTKLRPSTTHTTCPWKGQASYYDVVVGDQVNHDAAWYYPAPKPAASEIKDHIAFWKGVKIDS